MSQKLFSAGMFVVGWTVLFDACSRVILNQALDFYHFLLMLAGGLIILISTLLVDIVGSPPAVGLFPKIDLRYQFWLILRSKGQEEWYFQYLIMVLILMTAILVGLALTGIQVLVILSIWGIFILAYVMLIVFAVTVMDN